MRLLTLALAWLTSAAWADDAVGEAPARFAGLDRIAEAIATPIVVRTTPLRVETPHGPITAEPAAAGLEEFAALLAEELAIYPKQLMKRTRLKRIVLVSGLAFDGQLRGAIPDYAHDVLYYDVARGSYSRSYQKTAIHHEFFHVVDYRDDGQVYRDDAWAALNPDGFRYGDGGRAMQEDALVSLLVADLPGFLTRYATAGVEEDKAEVFSRMIVAPREVARLAAADPILARKVRRIKTLMRSFDPAVDDDFWKRVDDRDPDPKPQ